MSTKKVKQQAQVTIFAAIDGTTVKLFLANKGKDISSSDKVKDVFPTSADARDVLITIMSTNDKVSVTNKITSPQSPTWTNNQTGACAGITFYWAYASIAIPTETDDPFKDQFNITVGSVSTDPTAIIERTG